MAKMPYLYSKGSWQLLQDCLFIEMLLRLPPGFISIPDSEPQRLQVSKIAMKGKGSLCMPQSSTRAERACTNMCKMQALPTRNDSATAEAMLKAKSALEKCT